MVTVLRDVVAVGKDVTRSKLHLCWFPEIVEVEGTQFVQIVSGEYRFKKFVNNDCRMYEAMVEARNEASVECMKGLNSVEDPSAERTLPDRPKSELADEIPKSQKPLSRWLTAAGGGSGASQRAAIKRSCRLQQRMTTSPFFARPQRRKR